MSDSISRQFARWAAKLTYDDLPPAVVDKVKALVLAHLVGGGIGQSRASVRRVVELVKAEDSKPDGATILGDGAKVTRHGATIANTEIVAASGLWDSYRMFPHPGPVLIPVALVNAEVEHRSVREMITALVAGYEFECRLAHDHGAGIAAQGFRPSSVLATAGATMVAAKLLGLDEDGIVDAIAIGAGSASGISGGGWAGMEPNAARMAVFAAQLARIGVEGRLHTGAGSETSIEGDGGFLYAYAGRREGRLPDVFTGPHQIDLNTITDGLGQEYKLLDVMFRLYPVAGFNMPVIELLTDMKRKHGFAADDVEEINVFMNYHETELFRQPAYSPRVGSTHYYAAHVAVNGGYPVAGGKTFGPTGDDLTADQGVLEFMQTKVRVVGVREHPTFTPKITVRMRGGMTYSEQFVYESIVLNFDQLVERLQDCVPGLPGGQHHLDDLVDTMRRSDDFPSVQPLFEAFART